MKCNRCSHGFRALLVVIIIAGANDSLWAQTRPPWFLRVEAGQAEPHNWSDKGGWLGIRVARQVDQTGYLRFDAGIAYSSADENFLTLELGLEAKPLPLAVFTPFIGASVGLLTEPEFGGEVFRVVFGVAVNPRARAPRLRFGVQRGRHGGVSGPHVFFGGIEFPLGRGAQP